MCVCLGWRWWNRRCRQFRGMILSPSSLPPFSLLSPSLPPLFLPSPSSLLLFLLSLSQHPHPSLPRGTVKGRSLESTGSDEKSRESWKRRGRSWPKRRKTTVRRKPRYCRIWRSLPAKRPTRGLAVTERLLFVAVCVIVVLCAVRVGGISGRKYGVGSVSGRR